jgi:hypothetical protein
VNWDTLAKVVPLIVSLGVFWVAYSQLRTAQAKFRLDLYNRRFAIYNNVLQAHSDCFGGDYDKGVAAIGRLFFDGREATFLFHPKDGIGKILFSIAVACDTINRAKASSPAKTALGKSMEAEMQLSVLVLHLEEKMTGYLDFRQVNGLLPIIRRVRIQPFWPPGTREASMMESGSK